MQRSPLLLLTLLAACSAPTTPAPVEADPRSAPSEFAESHFAQVGDVRLEYFQFGEEAPAVVFVQDHHDYFRLEEAESWVQFLSGLSDGYRIIAPVRRGWGQSDDPEHGYDVATQASDLLGLIDVLEIEKAVFVGRTLATQDMLWIAEHHPERVQGLVFLGTPLLSPPGAEPSPELQRFHQMHSRLSVDLGVGEQVDRRLDRGDWSPRFLTEEDLRLQVPALLTQHPFFDADGTTMDARRLDQIERWGEDEQAYWKIDPDSYAYAQELRAAPERLVALRREAAAAAPNPTIRDAVKRAFGDRLDIVWEDPAPPSSEEDALAAWASILRTFLAKVTRG